MTARGALLSSGMMRVMVIVPLVFLAACSSWGVNRSSGRTLPTMPHPFDPVTLRVHGLTHIDPTGPKVGADQCLLVLHFELKDRFGDTVKGLGPLKVELYKPGAGVAPGIETQALSWELPDFADPEANASRFDTATNTYRIPLIAGKWADQWLDPGNEGLRERAPAWLKVRASLSTQDADRRAVLLSDEFVVQR
ncbi:hypothetical protein PHYC_00293 [Phycisphaerales bacterium]|nr:hypothetical protein PHYC_00293 [Phycisphaerales bacterium]